MPDRLPPHDAAACASQHLRQSVLLIDRFDLGAEGAYLVAVGDTSYVFKYWSGDQAAALRRNGPRWGNGWSHAHGKRLAPRLQPSPLPMM